LQHLEAEGLTEKDALKRIARESGQGKSDLYRELQRERAKNQNSSGHSQKRG
jgi:16S rRNA (cytidine1402-2'-O)-methyltransferase